MRFVKPSFCSQCFGMASRLPETFQAAFGACFITVWFGHERIIVPLSPDNGIPLRSGVAAEHRLKTGNAEGQHRVAWQHFMAEHRLKIGNAEGLCGQSVIGLQQCAGFAFAAAAAVAAAGNFVAGL